MADDSYYIDTNLIDAPGHDIRLGRDINEHDDLLVSIRENGILQPLLVRPRGDRYEVIAGNRRLQVARQLGLVKVPAMVRNASDLETSIYRFEENLKRADINPVEEAKYIAESITALGLSTKEFAAKINRTEDWIASRLSIAEMPQYLQAYLIDKKMPLGVALALNEITDDKVKNDWSHSAVTYGMTVLAAKQAAAEFAKMERRRQSAPVGEDPPPPPKEPPVAYVYCIRCGGKVPQQHTKFVRICAPECAIDAGSGPPALGESGGPTKG